MKKENRVSIKIGKVWILLSLLLLFACSEKEDFSTTLNFDQETYNINRQLWEESNVANYEFVQEFSSTAVGTQPKIQTIINNNKLDTVYVLSDINESTSCEGLNCYENITEVYDYIDRVTKDCEESINSSENSMKGAQIQIEYHDVFHYPTKINCSGFYPDGFIGGLSVLIVINDFELN